MQFDFTERDYTGEYKFGGRLKITAENAEEVQALIDHFRLFKDVNDTATLEARIAALKTSTLSHTVGTDKRPMYEHASALPSEFMTPYKEWAERFFGFTGVFPDLELPRKWGGLIHTNYQARVYTQFESICFEAFTSAEPWNGKDAQTYAESLISDYIGEEFGTRYREPEFIPAGNNHMKRNPNYLKRHPSKPQASNARLKRAFFKWWLANEATEQQAEIVAGNAAIVAETGDYMDAFEFERHESHIHWGKVYNKDGKTTNYKTISFADFAAMGGLVK